MRLAVRCTGYLLFLIAAAWTFTFDWGPVRGPVVFGTALVVGVPVLLVACWRWSSKILTVRGREARGLCLSCGYDLRATPGRCPECGAAPAGPAVQAPSAFRSERPRA